MSYDFFDNDHYDYVSEGSYSESGSGDSENYAWNAALTSTKRLTAQDCKEQMFELRYCWSENFTFTKASKYVGWLELFYPSADAAELARHCMSVQYSLAAMIMHGRPKATVTRKERNQIDARIKAVYRTAFQIYSDNLPLKNLKTTLRSSSVVTEAGINLTKQNRPLDCDNVIKFLEARFGHYNLKIPVDWVKRSEYDDSDDDDGGDAGEAHID